MATVDVAVRFEYLARVTGGRGLLSGGVPGVDLGAITAHKGDHYVLFGDAARIEKSDWGEPWRLVSPDITVPDALAIVSRNPAVIDVFWIQPGGSIGIKSWWQGK